MKANAERRLSASYESFESYIELTKHEGYVGRVPDPT